MIGTFALLTLAMLAWGYSQFGWMFYRYHSTACQQRGKAYEARVETLKRDAPERLRIGTPKEDAMRFFRENAFRFLWTETSTKGRFTRTDVLRLVVAQMPLSSGYVLKLITAGLLLANQS